MSRRNIRSVLTALVVAGGLALAPPNADAGGRAAQEPNAWSLALRWIADFWQEKVVRAQETQGWLVDPNGVQTSTPPVPPGGATSDQGWLVDPNG